MMVELLLLLKFGVQNFDMMGVDWLKRVYGIVSLVVSDDFVESVDECFCMLVREVMCEIMCGGDCLIVKRIVLCQLDQFIRQVVQLCWYVCYYLGLLYCNFE